MFHMCTNFGCLRSWWYCNGCPEVLLRTGIGRLCIKWDGYCRLVAWTGVIILAMEVFGDRVRQAIGPRYVAFSTLGVRGSMVCGTYDLVRCATGSYCFLLDGIFGANGAALDVWMTNLGVKHGVGQLSDGALVSVLNIVMYDLAEES